MEPDDWRARLAHNATSLVAAALRGREGHGESVPVVVEPPGVAVASLNTLTWNSGGCGSTVVLLHGINANARYWTGVASQLAAAGHRVLAPDLRGHGGTGPLGSTADCPLAPQGGSRARVRSDARDYTHAAMRADLLAWLEALQLEPRARSGGASLESGAERARSVDLIGHSMGGKVAADLAAARPTSIRRLVLVDPVPPEGLHPFFGRVAALQRAVFAPERGPFGDRLQLEAAHRTISWLRHAEEWMHRAFDANFTAREDGTIHPVLDPAAYEALFQGVLRQPSPLSLTAVTMPVLLIRASFSVMPFESQVRRLRRQLPLLRTRRLTGEHSLHATNPVGLAAALVEFLA